MTRQKHPYMQARLFLQELDEEYLYGYETKWISQGIYSQEGI